MSRIGAIPMTIELLRYSRIEKALLLIADTAQEFWPPDLVSTLVRLNLHDGLEWPILDITSPQPEKS